MKYRGVVEAETGMLLGGVKKHISTDFDTKAEASAWIAAIVEGNGDANKKIGKTRIVTVKHVKKNPKHRTRKKTVRRVSTGKRRVSGLTIVKKTRKVTRVKRNPHRTVPPIKKSRSLDNTDLWAAVRGLGMFKKSVDQLINLYNEHKDKEAFASHVIAEAAKQVAITKGAKFVRK